MSARRLAFDNLTGGYGSTTIVRDLSGGAAAGEVLCVLGRNGVGKTTLMKLADRLSALRRRAGSARRYADHRARSGRAPPRRHHLLPAGAAGIRRPFGARQSHSDARQPQACAVPPLFRSLSDPGRRLNQHAGTLSGGEKKMLSFVRGFAEDQPVILLDEPSEGVQWENILNMTALIDREESAGTALIVVEQNLAFAERIADHYLVMDQGRASGGSRSGSSAATCSRICMCEPD